MKAIAGPSEFQAKAQLKRIQKRRLLSRPCVSLSIEKRTLCGNEQRFAPLLYRFNRRFAERQMSRSVIPVCCDTHWKAHPRVGDLRKIILSALTIARI